MRNILILLLLIQACNKNSIRSMVLEQPGVAAVNRINETTKTTIALIDKYDSFLKNIDLNVLMVDTELSKLLLIQKDDYMILAQEKCPGDSNDKYWESKFTFETKSTKSDQVKKTRNENPDSIKEISFMNTFVSVLESDPIERVAILKSNEIERMKLRIALAEYKFQLSGINKSKYNCNFRNSLLYSYLIVVKIFLIKSTVK